jgi:GT2 family glycosyltransferase
MLSIIICSINEENFKQQQHQYARLLGDRAFEIIGVHDARSLCEGYNRGVARASKDATHFIFAHDDIEFLSDDVRPKLERSLREFDVVGVAGASRAVGGLWSFAAPPYTFGQIAHFKPPPLNVLDVEIFGVPGRQIGGIQLLDGVFIAAHRKVVERITWDAQTFDGWHGYDVDWSFRAHLAGFRLGVACDIAVIHASSGKPDNVWETYAARFVEKHRPHLLPQLRRQFQISAVRTHSRKDALEVMTPPWWPPLQV